MGIYGVDRETDTIHDGSNFVALVHHTSGYLANQTFDLLLLRMQRTLSQKLFQTTGLPWSVTESMASAQLLGPLTAALLKAQHRLLCTTGPVL